VSDHIREIIVPASAASPVAEFLLALRKYSKPVGNFWVFRGQSAAWPLRPSAGRDEVVDKYKQIREMLGQRAKSPNPNLKKLLSQIRDLDVVKFHQWRKEAVAFTKDIPGNEFECLAFAQHYGLATRLLDWSTNALVALYFAVESNPKEDGIVFALRPGAPIKLEGAKMLSIEEPKLLRVRPFDRRLAAQSGCFTYHPNPVEEFAPKPYSFDPKSNVSFVRLIIPKSSKSPLRYELADIGISRKFLFPDLDGLSSFLNWDRLKGF